MSKTEADVLVVFDRSRSVYTTKDSTSGVSNWQTSLLFFQAIVQHPLIPSNTNFALATFSEDYRIHVPFERNMSHDQLVKEAEFGPRWRPSPPSDPDALTFGYTDFGLVDDILREAYQNRSFSSNGVPRTPVIFLVTDGSMDGQASYIYDRNSCPEPNAPHTCGRVLSAAASNACYSCWRDHLATGLDGVRVKDSVYVVGIGAQDQSNPADLATISVFAQNQTNRVILSPDYESLFQFALDKVVRAANLGTSCTP